MARIIFRDLHPPDVDKFIDDLTPEQMINLLGSRSIGYIINITDTVKINSSGDNTYEGTDSFNFHDNKTNTVDYSRSNYNRFFY